MTSLLEEMQRLEPYLTEQQVTEVDNLLSEGKTVEAYRLAVSYINEGDATRSRSGRRLYRTISRESGTVPRHIWNTVEGVPLAPFAPSNPDLTCTNVSTIMGDEAGQVRLDNLVLMTLNDNTSTMYCYDKDEFRAWLDSELSKNIRIHSALEWVTGCKRPGGTLDAKIVVDPYTGLFIDGVINTLFTKGCRAFILVRRGHFFIESEFAVGTIHDRNVDVYTAVPIQFNVLAGLQGTNGLGEYKRRLNLPSTCVNDTRIVMPLDVYQELARRADDGHELGEVVEVEDLLRIGERYGMDLTTYVRQVRHDDPRGCTALTTWMDGINQDFGEFGLYTPRVLLGKNCQLGIQNVGAVQTHNYPFYDTSPGSGWSEYYSVLWRAIKSVTTELRTSEEMHAFIEEVRNDDAPRIGVLFERRIGYFIVNVFNVTDWRCVAMIIAYYSWMGRGTEQARVCRSLNVFGDTDFDLRTYEDRWLHERGLDTVRCHSFTSYSNFLPPPTLSFRVLNRYERDEDVRIEEYPHIEIISTIREGVTRSVQVRNVRSFTLVYYPTDEENTPENRGRMLTIPLRVTVSEVDTLDVSDLDGLEYTLEITNVDQVIGEMPSSSVRDENME